MTQESDVDQDLSHIHWSWPEAIAANPARSLATADLAIDYFAYSPFFDTKSNNSVLRTQRRVENPAYGHAEEKFELNAFRSGFEYIVAHSQPPNLFVIHRRDVQPDGSRNSVNAAYFILQDKVYPTPTLYGVMAARLRNASHLVSATFSTLSASHPPSNPRATSQWRSLPPSAPSDPMSVDKRVSNQAEDTEMPGAITAAEEEPEVIALVKKKGSATTKMPDYHLYNALQATRAALGDLNTMSATAPASRDPRDELRAVEAEIMGKHRGAQAKSAGIAGDGSLGGQGRSVGTPLPGSSLRPGASPVISMSAGGRAQSAAASAVGQSPVATMTNIAT